MKLTAVFMMPLPWTRIEAATCRMPTVLRCLPSCAPPDSTKIWLCRLYRKLRTKTWMLRMICRTSRPSSIVWPGRQAAAGSCGSTKVSAEPLMTRYRCAAMARISAYVRQSWSATVVRL